MALEEVLLFTSLGRGVSARARSRQTTISSCAPASAEPRSGPLIGRQRTVHERAARGDIARPRLQRAVEQRVLS